MKILVAQDALHAEGGVESYLAAIVPALRARGHSLGILFVTRGKRAMLAGDLDGPYVGLDGQQPETVVGDLRAWRPDVCFSNNMVRLDVERRLLAEWPVVKFMHGYFGTCVSGLKTHLFPRGVACGRRFGPACVGMYVPRHCGALAPAALVDGYRWAHAQQQLFHRYRTIVVASEHMVGEYARHGVERDRIAMLPLFPSGAGSVPAETRQDTVLFLGRMTPLKGGDVLIRAVARARTELGRPIHLVMAGDGPQKTEWQRLARNEGLDLTCPGWLDQDGRVKVLAQASVLAVPSVWPEPFGLVGLEAAASGVPAVAFDTGGIRQWLRAEVNGLLVPPSTGYRGMARALVTVIDNPTLRHRLSVGALAAAREMSLDAHVAGLERVLAIAASAQRHPSDEVTTVR